MSTINALVKDFLAQKKIAIVGVSDQRETGCNANYHKFKNAGYQVYAVNPRISTFEGAPCYPDLKSIPEKPEAVFILANPKVTEAIVRQCVELGIKHVWMHCMMGTKPGLAAGITSVLLVLFLSQARVFMAMARDGLLPKIFGEIHPRVRTQGIFDIVVNVDVRHGGTDELWRQKHRNQCDKDVHIVFRSCVHDHAPFTG